MNTSANRRLLLEIMPIPVYIEADFLNSAPLLLELPSFLVAAGANPHRVVPAAGWHGPSLLRAVVAHALTAGATVMDGEAWGELPLALIAGVDVLIWNPVGRPSRILHQSWMHSRESSNY